MDAVIHQAARCYGVGASAGISRSAFSSAHRSAGSLARIDAASSAIWRPFRAPTRTAATPLGALAIHAVGVSDAGSVSGSGGGHQGRECCHMTAIAARRCDQWRDVVPGRGSAVRSNRQYCDLLPAAKPRGSNCRTDKIDSRATFILSAVEAKGDITLVRRRPTGFGAKGAAELARG